MIKKIIKWPNDKKDKITKCSKCSNCWQGPSCGQGSSAHQQKCSRAFEKVKSMIFSCWKVYSMDPNGFTGRPGTGRVSREAFATMTQVHLSFKTCICLCLGLFICHYDPGSIVFVILNMYSSLSRSLYLQIWPGFSFFVFVVATLTWILLSKICSQLWHRNFLVGRAIVSCPTRQ